MQDNGKVIALLIDAENVSPTYIKAILDEVAVYGTPAYKRIYGDWTNNDMSNWKRVLLENNLTPIQQFSYTQGKNATDSAMVIRVRKRPSRRVSLATPQAASVESARLKQGSSRASSVSERH